MLESSPLRDGTLGGQTKDETQRMFGEPPTSGRYQCKAEPRWQAVEQRTREKHKSSRPRQLRTASQRAKGRDDTPRSPSTPRQPERTARPRSPSKREGKPFKTHVTTTRAGDDRRVKNSRRQRTEPLAWNRRNRTRGRKTPQTLVTTLKPATTVQHNSRTNNGHNPTEST